MKLMVEVVERGKEMGVGIWGGEVLQQVIQRGAGARLQVFSLEFVCGRTQQGGQSESRVAGRVGTRGGSGSLDGS